MKQKQFFVLIMLSTNISLYSIDNVANTETHLQVTYYKHWNLPILIYSLVSFIVPHKKT